MSDERLQRIRVIPDRTGTQRVRAEYGGRVTAWPVGHAVTIAEIITEFAELAELPESLLADAALRTCGDPDCDEPAHRVTDRTGQA